MFPEIVAPVVDVNVTVLVPAVKVPALAQFPAKLTVTLPALRVPRLLMVMLPFTVVVSVRVSVPPLLTWRLPTETLPVEILEEPVKMKVEPVEVNVPT